MTRDSINNWLQWTATVLTVIGALCTALNMYPQNVVAFNVGSALWLAYALRVKAKPLIVVNVCMLLIYFGGILKALI